MNKYFTEQMNTAWKEWHGNMSKDDIPITPNPSFEKGFNSAIDAVRKTLKCSLIAVNTLIGVTVDVSASTGQSIDTKNLKDLSEKLKAIIE